MVGKRWLYGFIGCIFMVLAVIGALLPVIPATPFLIGAAWAFAQSFPRVERWLYENKYWGPTLVRWRDERVIPLRIKIVAWGSMAASFTFLCITRAPWWVLAISASIIALGSWYIARVPSFASPRVVRSGNEAEQGELPSRSTSTAQPETAASRAPR